MEQRQAFDVFADYHQFYLWDRGMTAVAPTDYTDEDVRRPRASPCTIFLRASSVATHCPRRRAARLWPCRQTAICWRASRGGLA